MDLRNLQKADPLKRSVEKQAGAPEYSPMDPPDAYAPPGAEEIPYEAMPGFLQQLMDEHKTFRTELESFEMALVSLQENGLTREGDVDDRIQDFFRFLDDEVVGHSQKEEKTLFPLLQERLLDKGEHSQGKVPTTAVDMLEDDHSKVMQLAAVAFNFLGLAVRLPDARSRAIVLDAAIEQGKALVELLRLHIFREENVVFPLAVKHLSEREFDDMSKR